MPCLILTGHPCVGKTTVAQWIKNQVEDRRNQQQQQQKVANGDQPLPPVPPSSLSSPSLWGLDHVIIVNEASACPGRTMEQCYADAASEKATRGAIKSEFDRQVAAATACASSTSTTLVICDSMNYIKGFRYELHCISKASGQRHGVLWILNSVDVANAWNEQRRLESSSSSSSSYLSPTLMNELRQRYEPPDARNRWDQPLFTLDMSTYLPKAQDQLDEQQRRSDSSEMQVSRTDTVPSSSNNNNNSVPTASGNHDLAQDALQRSVYNMHALRDAFGSNTDGESAATTNPSPAAPAAAVKKATFKRAGFRRATAPSSATANNHPNVSTATTTTATSSTIISPLTLANLQSAQEESQTAHQPTAETIPLVTHESRGPHHQHRTPPAASYASTDTAVVATTTTSTATTMEERIQEILESFLCKNIQPLKEGVSTRVHVHANANALHNIDTVTHQVLHAISASLAQSSEPPSSDGKLVLARFNLTLTRRRPPPTMSELQRLRQQYLRWVANYPPTDTSEQGIAASFLSYIEAAQPEA